jgi:hypothetical protein
MTDEQQPTANRLAELPEHTRAFLSNLSPEQVKTIEVGLPILGMVIGFGKVAKWLAIALLSVMAGVLMLGESIFKIIGWFSKGD